MDGDGIDDLGLTQGPEADDGVGAVLHFGGSGLAGGDFAESAALQLLGTPTMEAVAELDSGRALFTLEYGGAVLVNPPAGSTLDPDGDADFHLYRLPGEGSLTRASWVEWFGDAGDSLLIGGPGSPEGVDRGEVLAWRDNEIAEHAYAADLGLRVLGEQPGDRAGEAIALHPDLDGDGHEDLLVGAPLADGSFADSGRAYVLAAP